MTSRSACEPLPKPTLSPFALARPGTFLRVGFFTAAVWCVPALRVPLVHSLINHFRKKKKHTVTRCELINDSVAVPVEEAQGAVVVEPIEHVEAADRRA